MSQRLTVVVLVELAFAAFLVAQLSDDDAAPAPPSATPAQAAASAGDAAVARETAAVGGAPPPPANEPPAPAARTEAHGRWRADDPVGIVLEGSITSRDGAPVAEPSVYVHQDRSGRSAHVANGGYALAGLQPGDWKMTVRAEGFADLVQSVTLTEDPFQRRDLTLDRSFPVNVRLVTPDGKDATTAARVEIPDAGYRMFHVVGGREPFPERLAATDYGAVLTGTARWKGEMNPRDGHAGVLAFVDPPPNYAALLMRNVRLDQQRVEPGQTELTFVVDVAKTRAMLGRVTVRVVDDETGEPLAGARVNLNTSSSGGGGRPTAADGTITFEHALPGLLFLEVAAKDREDVRSTIRVQPGETLDVGELRVGKPVPLTGCVLDADGKPAVAGVSWTELKWRSVPRQFVHNRSARCDSEGKFVLQRAGRGRIAITARAADGRIAVAVVDNPSAAPVELRLGPAATLVVLRSPDPTQAYTLTLFDARRQPIDAWLVESRTPRMTYSLPPGDYSFEAHDDGDRLVHSGSVSLGAGPATISLP